MSPRALSTVLTLRSSFSLSDTLDTPTAVPRVESPDILPSHKINSYLHRAPCFHPHPHLHELSTKLTERNSETASGTGLAGSVTEGTITVGRGMLVAD